MTLDSWVASRIGRTATPENVQSYRMEKLRECVAYAIENSRFYRALYKDIEVASLQNISDMAMLPMICADDIRKHGDDMLCLPQSRVRRIVTFSSSGTTGQPKRLYFSDEDLELTLDFFAHGMNTLSKRGDNVMICMNGSTPDSLGDLLAHAIKRFGAIPHIYGEISDTAHAAEYAEQVKPDCIVGIPGQISELAQRTCGTRGTRIIRPRTVLLSADNVPDDIRQTVENAWNCKVYAHWGMTETGLGGGVECHAGGGYHLRHDIIFEIIATNSATPIYDNSRCGNPLPCGEVGEIAVSTLNRCAMPLIRYRTGDLSRLIDAPCLCGSTLTRLGHIEGHYSKTILKQSNVIV